MQKRRNHAGFLNSIQLLESLDKAQKLKLVDGLQQITTDQGKFVFQENDIGNEFFIIEKGEVECLKVLPNNEFKLIRNLKAGDHFGELALINNEARTLSIRAKT